MIKHVVVAVALAALFSQGAMAQSPPRRVQKAETAFSLDTPIVKLLADSRAKAVLTKHMPTLVGSPHLGMFEKMSMRQLAADPHAVIPASKLRALQADLVRIK